MAEDGKKNYVKTDVIARLFGKTTRRIQQLTVDGILPTVDTPEGRRYDFIPTIQRYIKHLDDRASRGSQSLQEKEEKKLDAEIKYRQAKAEKAALEVKELKGTLHRAEDIEKLTNELVFSVRAMLLAMPGRVAMDLAALNTAPEVSRYLARHVGAMLNELSTHEYNPDTYKELVREREGWLSDKNEEIEGDDEVDDDGD